MFRIGLKRPILCVRLPLLYHLVHHLMMIRMEIWHFNFKIKYFILYSSILFYFIHNNSYAKIHS